MNGTITLPPAGTWTGEMENKLREAYEKAREGKRLHLLADELGVSLYQLYSKAHRMGLARQIRRR